MKKLFLIALVFCSFTVYCGDSLRVVTKTSTNNVYLVGLKRAKDKNTLYYLNQEKSPFTGKIIEFDSYGNKSYETSYLNGLQHGQYTIWTTASKVKYQCTYCNGKLCGECKEWTTSGDLDKVSNYDSNGELHGYIVFYRNYNRTDTSTVQYYVHGKREGKWVWYYSKGNPQTIEEYKNDERISYINYNEDGSVK